MIWVLKVFDVDCSMDLVYGWQVCPVLSLPLIERILHDFVPDEFSPNPVSHNLLAAIHNEVHMFSSNQFAVFLVALFNLSS